MILIQLISVALQPWLKRKTWAVWWLWDHNKKELINPLNYMEPNWGNQTSCGDYLRACSEQTVRVHSFSRIKSYYKSINHWPIWTKQWTVYCWRHPKCIRWPYDTAAYWFSNLFWLKIAPKYIPEVQHKGTNNNKLVGEMTSETMDIKY